jgi:acetyl-CoA acetyltransferase
MLAQIAVKNHFNGSLNPQGHFHNILTVEQVKMRLKWPGHLVFMIAVVSVTVQPLPSCAGLTCAKGSGGDPIYIKGLAISAGARQGSMRQDYDYVPCGRKRLCCSAGL